MHYQVCKNTDTQSQFQRLLIIGKQILCLSVCDVTPIESE